MCEDVRDEWMRHKRGAEILCKKMWKEKQTINWFFHFSVSSNARISCQEYIKERNWPPFLSLDQGWVSRVTRSTLPLSFT